MHSEFLLRPGYSRNWADRESVPEGRTLLLGRTLLIGKAILQEDETFSATMNQLTVEIARNDDTVWGRQP